MKDLFNVEIVPFTKLLNYKQLIEFVGNNHKSIFQK
jgi:hypothetical protein